MVRERYTLVQFTLSNILALHLPLENILISAYIVMTWFLASHHSRLENAKPRSDDLWATRKGVVHKFCSVPQIKTALYHIGDTWCRKFSCFNLLEWQRNEWIKLSHTLRCLVSLPDVPKQKQNLLLKFVCSVANLKT